MDKGALPPVTPINPYLGGNMEKKMSHLLHVCSFTDTLKALSLELNRDPGSLLEPYMSQGGQGVAEDTYCIERVKWNLLRFFEKVFRK